MIFNVNNIAGKTKIETIPSQASSLVYNGKEQSPSWTSYDPEQLTMTGVMSAVDAGTYLVSFAPTDRYKWADGTTAAKFVEWTIEKKDRSMSLSPVEITGLGVTKNIMVGVIGGGTMSVKSSNNSIATTSVSGDDISITSVGCGTATITVSVSASTNYKAISSKFNVTVYPYRLYDNGYISPTIGGFTAYAYGPDTSESKRVRPSRTDYSSMIKLSITKDSTTDNAAGSCFSDRTIDVTHYNKLNITVSYATADDNTGVCYLRFGIGVYKEDNFISAAAKTIIKDGASVDSATTFSCDLTGLADKYYVFITMYGNANQTITFTKLWLE
jgi:hypothetical protein